VVLAGPAGTVVKVNLVWGKADGDKQTAVVTIAGTGYKKYPLRFVAQADTDDARIQIVATGAGTLHIGAASLMPADNIQGFRAEVIAALKQLHSAFTVGRAGTSSPGTSGATRWATSTSVRRSWTRCGTRCSRTTWARTSS